MDAIMGALSVGWALRWPTISLVIIIIASLIIVEIATNPKRIATKSLRRR